MDISSFTDIKKVDRDFILNGEKKVHLVEMFVTVKKKKILQKKKLKKKKNFFKKIYKVLYDEEEKKVDLTLRDHTCQFFLKAFSLDPNLSVFFKKRFFFFFLFYTFFFLFSQFQIFEKFKKGCIVRLIGLVTNDEFKNICLNIMAIFLTR